MGVPYAAVAMKQPPPPPPPPPRDGKGPTVKKMAFDPPPPGDGLTTSTKVVPVNAMSAAEIDAVSWPADTKVVGGAADLKRTWEPLTKLLPLTVSVNASPPN